MNAAAKLLASVRRKLKATGTSVNSLSRDLKIHQATLHQAIHPQTKGKRTPKHQRLSYEIGKKLEDWLA